MTVYQFPNKKPAPPKRKDFSPKPSIRILGVKNMEDLAITLMQFRYITVTGDAEMADIRINDLGADYIFSWCAQHCADKDDRYTLLWEEILGDGTNDKAIHTILFAMNSDPTALIPLRRQYARELIEKYHRQALIDAAFGKPDPAA